jgi:peptidoglycan hydrolase-like protein with peptidoglycan-binding domain
VPVDGEFGTATERALKRWQTQQGLRASGVVGVATWRALLRSQAP